MDELESAGERLAQEPSEEEAEAEGERWLARMKEVIPEAVRRMGPQRKLTPELIQWLLAEFYGRDESKDGPAEVGGVEAAAILAIFRARFELAYLQVVGEKFSWEPSVEEAAGPGRLGGEGDSSSGESRDLEEVKENDAQGK